MSIEILSLYAAAYLAVAFAPGPAVIFITSQSAWRGRAHGVLAALGVESANVVFWTLSAFGLAAAIAASQTVFMALKWIGAAYLAWLGMRAIAGSFRRPESPEESMVRTKSAYRDGLIVGLSNPKAMLFFVTLAPQFLDPSRPTLPQIFALALIGVTISFSVNALYALAAGELRRAFSRGPVKRWFDRCVGGAFLSLAAVAALYRRAA